MEKNRTNAMRRSGRKRNAPALSPPQSSPAREPDHVRANTDPKVLAQIDERLRLSIVLYAGQPPEILSRRIAELDAEWDIERILECNASALALTSLCLALLGRRRWFLVTGGVLGFLLQHAIQGWCPPIPILRKLGVRTRNEIDREKYALKALRGDFKRIPPDKSPNGLDVQQVFGAIEH